MRELKEKGVIESGATFATVDDLLAALEGGSGTTARLIDMPPLEVDAMRETLTEFRSHASELPSQKELAAVYSSLERTAEREHRPLLDVSPASGSRS